MKKSQLAFKLCKQITDQPEYMNNKRSFTIKLMNEVEQSGYDDDVKDYGMKYLSGMMFQNKAKFSLGNSKLGVCMTASTPPLIGCSDVDTSSCASDCYALRPFYQYINNITPQWTYNLLLLKYDMDKYFSDCQKYIDNNTDQFDVIRIHVSGELLNKKHLQEWINIAHNNPTKDLYIYSKNLAVIIDLLVIDGYKLPSNFMINLSIMHNMPEIKKKNIIKLAKQIGVNIFYVIDKGQEHQLDPEKYGYDKAFHCKADKKKYNNPVKCTDCNACSKPTGLIQIYTH